MKYLYLGIMLLFLVAACSNQENSVIIKQHNSRDKVEDVKINIRELSFNEILASRFAYLKVEGQYLFISDLRSSDKLIHIYDNNSFKYYGSTGSLGQGPNEIASMGPIAYDGNNGLLYVLDFGSYNVYSFNIENAILDPDYYPDLKSKIKIDATPTEIVFINDSLCYGTFSIPAGNNYQDISGKWDMSTGAITLHNQKYPDLKVERVVSDYSKKYNLLAECNTRYDLINVFDGDLILKFRIFGPNWNKDGDYKSHFKSVVFYNNYIITSYDGTLYEEYNKPKVCHVFDIDGNYVKTLHVGYKIWRMSVDEDNARLYFTFDDEIQFGYLDLKGILE